MKLLDLQRHLRRNHCAQVREGGRHTIWQNLTNHQATSVPRHREIKENLVRKICRDLEIPSP